MMKTITVIRSPVSSPIRHGVIRSTASFSSLHTLSFCSLSPKRPRLSAALSASSSLRRDASLLPPCLLSPISSSLTIRSLLFQNWPQRRSFSGYDGQSVSDDQLVKKSDDWVIEETNFCLGRKANMRFKETDDLAYRVIQLMDSQLGAMHTRLRDGTCIPVMAIDCVRISDNPTPYHIFPELGLVKWTWDETYDEAYEDNDEDWEERGGEKTASLPKSASSH